MSSPFFEELAQGERSIVAWKAKFAIPYSEVGHVRHMIRITIPGAIIWGVSIVPIFALAITAEAAELLQQFQLPQRLWARFLVKYGKIYGRHSLTIIGSLIHFKR